MSALSLSQTLLTLAFLLQAMELLLLKSAWSDQGIWRWSALRGDFTHYPFGVRWLFDRLLGTRGFTALLQFSLLIWIVPNASLQMAWIFFVAWLIAIRWRGTFNGGSDSMTVIVALSLWVAEWGGGTSWLTRGALAYIAVQLTASYFIAGLAKLRNPLWRNGRLIPIFLRTPGYDAVPRTVLRAMDHPRVAQIAAILLITFECTFPLTWINPRVCTVYFVIATGFHLVNFWVFGLNRFVFAWLAAYPAMFFWSGRLKF